MDIYGEKVLNAGNDAVSLAASLNMRKIKLNRLIDDFEGLALGLKKEISSGIGKEKILSYKEKMNRLNEDIISLRKKITDIEARIQKVEILTG